MNASKRVFFMIGEREYKGWRRKCRKMLISVMERCFFFALPICRKSCLASYTLCMVKYLQTII